MANRKHLALLKQGVKPWNEWRMSRPYSIAEIGFVDLKGARLRMAQLASYDLRGADLRQADLWGVSLNDANLNGASLSRADLREAHIRSASLVGADLSGASLRDTDLFKANLMEATFYETILARVNLDKADFTRAVFEGTHLDDVDLSSVKGLDKVIHEGPSHIGLETIFRSKGLISEVFLRSAGVPDMMITFMKSLVGTAIEFYSAFISYSNKDFSFAERLYVDLIAKNVRVWFAPEDLKSGDRIREAIDEAIHIYDKLMVVLSTNSIDSAWVRREVKAALEKEKGQNRTVLFPIRLDDAVMDSTEQWADDIRRTRHIGDFTKWKQHDDYQKAFDRLLRDLQAESQPPKA
jgi:uncharacterized protein YjbI with pentapeptide repeats